ncbi:MAG: U32 family peptidase, partial [Pseudomonadota bacterium]
ADAVYFGMKSFSLRSFAGNFDIEDAEKGLKLLHQKGKKGYVTLNIYPYSDEYKMLVQTAKELESINADAFIVSDLGVINELKKAKIKTPLHISTQANTMSSQAVLAYKEMGAKRVNLARELSLEQIKEIQNNLKGQVETEVFVHGAVCFSYSGRCAISDYMTGRKANRGECTHPCRWKYALVEEKRPGKYYPVAEDERGLYFFNNKDLALFPFIKELSSCGVNSLKIEGRMKTIHYISSVVSLYRRILDGENISEQEATELLNRVSNRGYSSGFIKGNVTPDDYNWDNSDTDSTSTFVANVIETSGDNTIFRVRNKINAGETLELLTPDGKISTMQMTKPLIKKDGTQTDVVNNEELIIVDKKVPRYSLLRRLELKAGG